LKVYKEADNSGTFIFTFLSRSRAAYT